MDLFLKCLINHCSFSKLVDQVCLHFLADLEVQLVVVLGSSLYGEECIS